MHCRESVKTSPLRGATLIVLVWACWFTACSTGKLPSENCPEGTTAGQCPNSPGDTAVDTGDAGNGCNGACGEGEACVDGGCIPGECTGEGCACEFRETGTGVCSNGEIGSDGECTEPPGYEADETSCDELDNDCDGGTDEGCGCDFDGTSEGVCSEGVVDESGDCTAPGSFEEPETSCDGKDNDCDGDTDEPGSGEAIECTPGTEEMEVCETCGEKVRTCASDCTWEPWSDCRNQGICNPGETQTGSCGNCGEQMRTCESTCQWGDWSTCTGEGSCSPGSTDSSGCPDCRATECTNSCEWTNECKSCTCQASQQCGTSCPDGFHVAASSCDPTCSGTCTTTDNARFCEPNCGSSFTSCESSCPTGYLLDRTTCDSSCPGDCSPGDNAIVCLRK